ncbi:MAG TPA: MFS transporter [Actinoplanes sp.]|nr:MFS transporter [Actinoplanes sp.]
MAEDNKTSNWTRRLGLPDLRGRGALLGTVAIDSLGTGVFFPFAIVYFTQTLHLDLTKVGAIVTAAMALAIVIAPFFGSIIDRAGPKPTLVVTFAVRAGAFALYPLVNSPALAIAAIFLTTVAEKVFWAANRTFVPLVAPGEVARWYGLERAIRNAGYGIGGLAASALILLGSGGLQAIVLINAVSFAVAAIALATWRGNPRTSEPHGEPTRKPTPGGSLAGVLRDGPFVALTLANTLLVLAGLSISVLLPLYAVFELGLSWLPGVIIAINAVVFVLLQSYVVTRVEDRRHARVLLVASLIWTVCFAIFSFARGGTAQITVAIIAGAVVYTLAELLWAASADTLAAELSPEHLRGRYMSVYQLSWSVGSAVAPGLLAALLDRGQFVPWVFLGLVCLAAAIIFVALDRKLYTRAMPATLSEHQEAVDHGSGTPA